ATITTDGGMLQLVATVTPANATNTAVTWSITTGASFATVNASGLVTAADNGTVTVRATAADGTVFGEITITITGQITLVTAVAVTVQNNAAATITTDGGMLQLVATVTPANATNTAVTWSVTTGAAFATVSATGLVTATNNGTVTVRATAADGTVFGEITITITGQIIPVTAVAVAVQNNAAATITTDGGTLQLVATVTPADATNTAVTWSITTGAAFATVDANGVVTATDNGTVTVTATAADGTVFGEITIIISGQVVAVTAVTVTVQNDAVATITTAGGTLQLVATVTPADATNTAVVWSVTSGGEFATVDANGIVTAIANGTVIVRATAADGTVYGEIEVLVAIILGIDDVRGVQYSVYPNPVIDVLTIDAATAVKEVSLFNMIGQQVYKGNRNTVNLQDKKQGVYILQVVFENGTTVSEKIVKN
ncbi:MAG: T9SS type A sorting domain-containing protein, partial [Sphingobacteriales bacterium]